MNVSKRTVMIALSVLVLLLIVVGLIAGWATWLLITIPTMLVVVVILTEFLAMPAPPPPPLPPPVVLPPPPPPTPPPPLYQQVKIGSVALPSAVADYDFLFSATVNWRGLGHQHGSPAGVAADLIVARAREAVAHEPPDRHSLAQANLNGLLGQVTRDRADQVEAWATEVWLTLSQQDMERLQKMADVRKDEEVWEHQRRWERSKRVYLGEEVLKTPGSAVVWWLSRKDDEIEGAVNLIGHLARLSATAHDAEVPEPFRHLDPVPAPARIEVPKAVVDGQYRWTPDSVEDYVGELIDRIGFGGAGKESERALLVERFATVIEAAERPDIAEAVRLRFGALRADNGSGALDVGEPAGDLFNLPAEPVVPDDRDDRAEEPEETDWFGGDGEHPGPERRD
ncbi:MAG TPA: hypothetical protein VGR06_12265 [Actinophytocola sp.]|jgi:hypothetical protein|uniref:hypothetical protein n=1 Tax=Actinophytocola sp. TaxID=1872138 RepID=UPI002DFDCC59|nr:hypothetical protein [Actinophytocola sp.]